MSKTMPYIEVGYPPELNRRCFDSAIDYIWDVMEMGLQKHGHSWRGKPIIEHLAHAFAHMERPHGIEGSGHLELAHAACRVLMALQLEIERRNKHAP